MARLERGDISAAWEQIVEHLGRPGQPRSRVPDAARGCRRRRDSRCGTLAEVYTAATFGPGGVMERRRRSGGRSMRSTELTSASGHTPDGSAFLGWLRP